jgi:hypothetical protein
MASLDCPICLNRLDDPVLLVQTGITYCRACIATWLGGGGSNCPATGQVLANKEVVSNYLARAVLDDLAAEAADEAAHEQEAAAPSSELAAPPSARQLQPQAPSLQEQATARVAELGPGNSPDVQERQPWTLPCSA